MKLFLDSSDVGVIKSALETGLIKGVTTNPTLVRKAGKKPDDLYQELIALGLTDVSMEVSGSLTEMVNEGVRLNYLFGDAATIKLPMTRDGLLACSQLSKSNIRTNVTLIFNAAQALLAAEAGATYVSPFVGRIDDAGFAGLEVVRSIADLYRIQHFDTKVLAASIRTPHRVVRSLYNGADIVTMPPSVFEQMYNNIFTDAGLRIFEEDLASIRANA